MIIHIIMSAKMKVVYHLFIITSVLETNYLKAGNYNTKERHSTIPQLCLSK